MIVVDTNVWARAFLRDHPDQSPRARQALALDALFGKWQEGPPC